MQDVDSEAAASAECLSVMLQCQLDLLKVRLKATQVDLLCSGKSPRLNVVAVRFQAAFCIFS